MDPGSRLQLRNIPFNGHAFVRRGLVRKLVDKHQLGQVALELLGVDGVGLENCVQIGLGLLVGGQQFGQASVHIAKLRAGPGGFAQHEPMVDHLLQKLARRGGLDLQQRRHGLVNGSDKVKL